MLTDAGWIDELREAAGQCDDSELVALCDAPVEPTRIADYFRGLALRDVQRAVDVTGRICALAEALPMRARALFAAARAHSLCLANRFDDALDELERAAAAARQVGDARALAETQLAAVHALARIGRLAEAEASAASAYAGFTQVGETVKAAMADANLGTVLRMRDDPRRALVHFDRARAALAPEPMRRAMIDSNRAEALLDLDDFAGATAAFDGARETFESLGNWHAAAIAEGNLAHAYSRHGRADLALQHFARAAERFERAGAAGDLARLRAEEAETLAAVGALRDSQQRFSEAVAALDEIGLPREAARARLGQALVLARLRIWDRAEAALVDAEARFSALGIAIGVSEARLARGTLRIAQHRPDEGVVLLRAHLGDVADRPARLAATRHAIVLALVEKGEPRAAAEELALLETEVGQIDLPAFAAYVQHARGRVRLALGDAAGAREALAAALDALDRVRVSLRLEALRAHFVAAHGDMYHDAWAVALAGSGPQRLAEAFAALERMRARSLLDALESAAQIAEAAPDPADTRTEELLRSYAAVRASLHAAYDQSGLGGDGTVSRVLGARRRIGELEQRSREIEQRLTATQRFEPVFAAPWSLDQTQAALRSGAVLLSFFVEHEKFGVLVVRNDRALAVRDLAPEREIAALVQRLHFHIDRAVSRAATDRNETAATAPLHEAARVLHARLIAPLMGALAGCDRLGVAPFGVLHNVPFGLLQDADGRLLLERFGLTCVPSATVGARLARVADEPTAQALPLLSVGVADRNAPHAEAEARGLAATVPNARLLCGPDGTRGAFADAAAQAALIHIATHGIFEAENPLSSRLLLSDGWLTAREIAALRLPGSTVVLAGCETGRGGAQTGEERYGLIRAFLAAGATCVVAAQWPLHDRTALDLFSRLYTQRAAASPKSAAFYRLLADSMLVEYRRGTPPARWAGLVAVGGFS